MRASRRSDSKASGHAGAMWAREKGPADGVTQTPTQPGYFTALVMRATVTREQPSFGNSKCKDRTPLTTRARDTQSGPPTCTKKLCVSAKGTTEGFMYSTKNFAWRWAKLVISGAMSGSIF